MTTEYETIAVKRATKERFKEAGKGKQQDYFINELLDLWQSMSAAERAARVEKEKRC